MILDRIIFHTSIGVSKIFRESECRSGQQTQRPALFFCMRSFPESWDKPELVIFLSIMMSGEGKTNMDIDILKM